MLGEVAKRFEVRRPAITMPTRCSLAACLLLSFLAAACGGPAGGDTPVVTGITTDAQVSWRPPEDPDLAARADISAALRLDRPAEDRIGPVLLPGPVPEGAGIHGVDSAELTVTRTVPSGVVRVDVVVRRADLSVVVSVSALAAGDLPACGADLQGQWLVATVRGLPGCSLLVPGAVSFLRWEEAGGGFHAEFGPEVSVNGLLAWLTDWYPAAG
jgi:hypothetical protein